jgi:hypothetical protein
MTLNIPFSSIGRTNWDVSIWWINMNHALFAL